jgi:hypothetical protein
MICISLYAQTEVKMNNFRIDDDGRGGKFYLIPEAGLWFGNYTNIEVAPQLGFHISDRWSIGAGPHYIFYKNNSYYSPINFSSNIWGYKAFTRIAVIRDASSLLPFYLFDELFAHFEYERMSLENQYFNAPSFPEEGRFWIDYFYVGGGLSQRIGANSSYSFMLLWNLNQGIFSLYRNPTYRVSFSIYL